MTSYIEKKIKNFDLIESFIVVVLIMLCFILGKFVRLNNIFVVLFVGLLFGLLGAVFLVLLQLLFTRKGYYEKGLDLEEKVAKKLKSLNLNFKQGVEISNGDLDFFVKKGESYYGFEVKNWAGVVEFENGLLSVNSFDHTYLLSDLLGRCKQAKNSEFGVNSKIFVKPVLVFGYKTAVNIPENKILFNNILIQIITINELKSLI